MKEFISPFHVTESDEKASTSLLKCQLLFKAREVGIDVDTKMSIETLIESLFKNGVEVKVSF